MLVRRAKPERGGVAIFTHWGECTRECVTIKGRNWIRIRWNYISNNYKRVKTPIRKAYSYCVTFKKKEPSIFVILCQNVIISVKIGTAVLRSLSCVKRYMSFNEV